MRCWLAAICGLVAAPLAAQPPSRVEGRVRVAAASDTAALSGARVVLHRVGLATQGPVDSSRTDARGRFAFRFAGDTTASYLLSTRFAGIEYFSAPVSADPAAPDTAVELVVFDTSSAVPTHTRSRTVVVSAPDAVGSRTVVDWFTIENPGVVTRVGDDSTPTWAAALPANIVNAGQGDARFSEISPDAVRFERDSVFVTAPIAPGDKSLLLQYELPAGERTLAFSFGDADSVDVYVEERNARVAGTAWVAADSQPFQGRTFFKYRPTGGPGADALELSFPGSGIRAGPALAALVGFLAAALGLGAFLGWRRRRPHAAQPAAADGATRLADRIARLDAELRRVPAGDPADRARLEAERRRLLAELRAALAVRHRRS